MFKAKQLIVIDFGSSKTAALLATQEKNRLQVVGEYIFGSRDLLVKDKLNFNLLNIFLEQIRDYFKQQFLLAETELVLSLPSASLQIHKTIHKLGNLQKIHKELEKKYLANNYILLNTLLNPQHDGNLELWTPVVEKSTLETLTAIARKLGFKSPRIVYPLAYFSKYTETPNYYLLNLGGKNIDLLEYRNNNLTRVSLLKLGGENVLKDIMTVLKLNEEEARIKLFGFHHLFDSFFDHNNQDILTKVIDARIKEIFQLLKLEIDGSAKTIYIFGGLANLPKVDDFLQQYLGVKVVNLNETVNDHSFITHQANLILENYWEGFKK